MYRIKTLSKISSAGLSRLDRDRFQVGSDVENEDGILVRSAKLHDYQFPASLWAIARAGAGVNNIPVERCSEAGIVVFNTPGANANAVKELLNKRFVGNKFHIGIDSALTIANPAASRLGS